MSAASRAREERRRLGAVMIERGIQLAKLEEHFATRYTPSFLRAGVAIAEVAFDEGHAVSTPRPAALSEVEYTVKPGQEAEYLSWIATVVERGFYSPIV